LPAQKVIFTKEENEINNKKINKNDQLDLNSSSIATNTELKLKSSWLDEMDNDDIVLLQPDESFAFSFMCTHFDTQIGKQVGYPEVKWCTTMGEYSVLRGEDTMLRNVLSNNTTSNVLNELSSAIKVQCIDCPKEVWVGDEFEVKLRIWNSANQPIPAQLNCVNYAIATNIHLVNAVKKPLRPASTSTYANQNQPNKTSPQYNRNNGLCIVGLTFATLGLLDSNEEIETSITVFAMCGGLHDLQGVSILDANTKKEYAVGSLAKIFVRE
jgi:hypothetical protein